MISSLLITLLSLLRHCKYCKNEVKTNKVMKVTKNFLFDEENEKKRLSVFNIVVIHIMHKYKKNMPKSRHFRHLFSKQSKNKTNGVIKE